MAINLKTPVKFQETAEDKRNSALEAMRQLRGSGNGNLMKALEKTRATERQNG
jgi:hypothetical protein